MLPPYRSELIDTHLVSENCWISEKTYTSVSEMSECDSVRKKEKRGGSVFPYSVLDINQRNASWVVRIRTEVLF